MEPTFEAPLDLSLTALAEATTTCFEDYVVPMHFTAPLAAGMIRTESIDLAASLYARDEEGPLAIALIARRDRSSRVAAMAVAKRARRQGLGSRLLSRAIEQAKERCDTDVLLEVIEQNPAAIALYESQGFQRMHRLVGFAAQLDAEGPGEARDVSLMEVAGAVQEKRLPWQITAASLHQMSSPTFGIEAAGVYAALTPVGEEALVCRGLGWNSEPDIRAWLGALGSRFPGRRLRLPPFFPEPSYAGPFQEAGMEPDSLSQFEMRLSL